MKFCFYNIVSLTLDDKILKDKVIVLKDQVGGVLDALGVCDEKKEIIYTMTNPLLVKDLPSWIHSAEVCLTNYEVANYMYKKYSRMWWSPKIFDARFYKDRKPWVYAGFMHDVGKALTDVRSLRKTEGFNEDDKRELDRHVEDGCRLLNGAFDFTAEIIKWHHYFSNGYPPLSEMPEMNTNLSRGSKNRAKYIGRRIGVIDSHNAITTRENDKYSTDGKPCLPSPKQAYEILLEKNPDQEYLIKTLYDAGIFK